MIPQLEDAILDLPKQRFAHWQMVKSLTKVNIQPGSSVPCKQWENIELFHVNEVSGHIFQPVRCRVNKISIDKRQSRVLAFL